MSGRIALATSADHLELTRDDQVLHDCLAAVGYDPEVQRWDDPACDWPGFRAVIIRSCWDYHRREEEFHAWLERLDQSHARVFNPVQTLRWNARKTYLRDLLAAGVPVVPTAWVDRGEDRPLRHIMDEAGWDRVVIKPVVSASASHTWRAGPEVAAGDEATFTGLATSARSWYSPFCLRSSRRASSRSSTSAGNFPMRSASVPGRAISGCRRSTADRRAARPAGQVIEQAAAALACAPTPTLYARVDGCEIEGAFQVMELELIEPWLFFLEEAEAAGRCVKVLEEMERGEG